MVRARTRIVVMMVVCALSLSCRDVVREGLYGEEPWESDKRSEATWETLRPADPTAAEISPDGGDAEAPLQLDSPSEVDESPISGITYRGSTTISEQYAEYWDGGEAVTNEIIIVVADDGTVTGVIASVWAVGPLDPIEWEAEPGGPTLYCVSDVTIIDEGALSGQLEGMTGVLDVELTHIFEVEHTDCPPGDGFPTFTERLTAEVIVTGDRMTGVITPDGPSDIERAPFTFEASRY